MIFVTVGTQLAFPRLLNAIDSWAEKNPSESVFAQIGPNSTTPKFIEHADFIKPTDVIFRMQSADLVVSHAGMGSILSALQWQRPILILPRLAKLGEHRNDHQLATARWLEGRPGIIVVWSENDIAEVLNNRLSLPTPPRIPDVASGPLIDKLKMFIDGEK